MFGVRVCRGEEGGREERCLAAAKVSHRSIVACVNLFGGEFFLRGWENGGGQ